VGERGYVRDAVAAEDVQGGVRNSLCAGILALLDEARCSAAGTLPGAERRKVYAISSCRHFWCRGGVRPKQRPSEQLVELLMLNWWEVETFISGDAALVPLVTDVDPSGRAGLSQDRLIHRQGAHTHQRIFRGIQSLCPRLRRTSRGGAIGDDDAALEVVVVPDYL
jgi:hypothetical protein